MTAFDRAWGVVKMPIVPGSVRRNYRAEEEEERRFLGEFDDPKTQERLTMNAIMYPDDDLFVEIQDQEDDTYKLHPRARSYFREQDMVMNQKAHRGNSGVLASIPLMIIREEDMPRRSMTWPPTSWTGGMGATKQCLLPHRIKHMPEADYGRTSMEIWRMTRSQDGDSEVIWDDRL